MTEHMEQALKARESLRRTRGSVRDPDRARRQQGPPPLGSTFQLLLARGGLLSETQFRGSHDPLSVRQDNEESPIGPREKRASFSYAHRGSGEPVEPRVVNERTGVPIDVRQIRLGRRRKEKG